MKMGGGASEQTSERRWAQLCFAIMVRYTGDGVRFIMSIGKALIGSKSHWDLKPFLSVTPGWCWDTMLKVKVQV
jgi:hypothetical protein